MAALKRRCNDLREAIALTTRALEILDDDDLQRQCAHASAARVPSSCSLSSDAGDVALADGWEAGGDGEREAAEEGADDDQRFELHFLRAKCHFDARDLTQARVDAQLAACLRPGDAEAQNLVAVLSMGGS